LCIQTPSAAFEAMPLAIQLKIELIVTEFKDLSTDLWTAFRLSQDKGGVFPLAGKNRRKE
ncbi:MAG: hypothetical protein ACE5IY_20470, partial [bacterium]